MEKKEKTNDKFKCCVPRMDKHKMTEIMANCCEGMSEAGNCRSMMAQCMKGCRWFPLIPVILGISLFLLGYYLDAEITRILWMVAAGFVILMGIFCFVMVSKMKQICCVQ